MGLDLDGHATGALDEGLHRPYVLTNAMRRILPMHIHEHVISVVMGEDALPVRLVPAREIELVHPLKIARYCFVGHLRLSPFRSIPGEAPGRARLLGVGGVVRTRANREARPHRNGLHGPRWRPLWSGLRRVSDRRSAPPGAVRPIRRQ